MESHDKSGDYRAECPRIVGYYFNHSCWESRLQLKRKIRFNLEAATYLYDLIAERLDSASTLNLKWICTRIHLFNHS